ncbi:MAG: LLM class flavin-dependent oxidoreductase [Actinomycetota bacterium]
MEYVCNYMAADGDPVGWARHREAQGWNLISVADHFFTDRRPYAHVWVTLGAMAAATTTVGLTTAFVNNLFRNPVEVAQASLSMQHLSQGRFELGLGAGWARDEAEQAGMAYPDRGARAAMFAEAAEVLRSILHTGGVDFDGDHYSVHIDGLGPVSDVAPPLVASVGGPRTIREVTPHCDRIELKAASTATRDGALDFAALTAIEDSQLIDLVANARDANPDIDLGMFVLCNVGEDERTTQLRRAMNGKLYGRFFGPPEHVAEGLAWLAEIGISRCQLSAFDDASLDRIAPLLFADRPELKPEARR